MSRHTSTFEEILHFVRSRHSQATIKMGHLLDPSPSEISSSEPASTDREPSPSPAPTPEPSSSPEPELEDYQEYRSPMPEEPCEARVVDAIHTATLPRLQTLLISIIKSVPAANELAEKELLVAWEGQKPSLKRKRFETCKNCKEEYNTARNYKGSCVYHEGKFFVLQKNKRFLP